MEIAILIYYRIERGGRYDLQTITVPFIIPFRLHATHIYLQELEVIITPSSSYPVTRSPRWF